MEVIPPDPATDGTLKRQIFGITKLKPSPRSVKILSFLEPASNPRVPKEAEALVESGIEIEIVTSALPRAQVIPTKDPAFCKVRRLNRMTPSLGLWWHRILKGTSRIWPVEIRALVAGYGSLFYDLYSFLKKRKGSEFIILHLEPALLAGYAAGMTSDAAVDFEDWYSEDLLPGSRSPEMTQILRQAEKTALQTAATCWCTSKAMAGALSLRYGVPKPLVIRNTFPRRYRQQIDGKWKDRPGIAKWMRRNDPSAERPKEAPVSILWFSQTIGPGRGLEVLFAALEKIEGNWELHLRGGLWSYGPWLERVCSPLIKNRLTLHGLVDLTELSSRLAEHDVGICAEPAEPANKNVTISNKFFHYLQCGLAVVASDTEGQKEAGASAPGAVRLYPAGDSDCLRRLVQVLVTDRSQLAAMRRAAWEAGEKLCWENEAPALVEAVKRAMEKIQQSKKRGT